MFLDTTDTWLAKQDLARHDRVPVLQMVIAINAMWMQYVLSWADRAVSNLWSTDPTCICLKMPEGNACGVAGR